MPALKLSFAERPGSLVSWNLRHRYSDALIRSVSFPANLRCRSEGGPFVAAVNRSATQNQTPGEKSLTVLRS